MIFRAPGSSVTNRPHTYSQSSCWWEQKHKNTDAVDWTQSEDEKKRREVSHSNATKSCGSGAVWQLVAHFYRVVLVWIVVSRGQCVTIGFIKAKRRRGLDLRKSPATVRGEVDGGLPGPAVVSGLLQNKPTGTRALWWGEVHFLEVVKLLLLQVETGKILKLKVVKKLYVCVFTLKLSTRLSSWKRFSRSASRVTGLTSTKQHQKKKNIYFSNRTETGGNALFTNHTIYVHKLPLLSCCYTLQMN